MSGNPRSALADYANNVFIGLVSCDKVFCFINNFFSYTKIFVVDLLTYDVHSEPVHI